MVEFDHRTADPQTGLAPGEKALLEFTEGEPLSSPLMNPLGALEWEFARIIGRIKWFDARIVELSNDRDIWFDLVKREEVMASEFAGVNKIYEAREHTLVKMQGEERTRLANLSKIWIDAKFDAARMEAHGQFARAINRTVRAVLASLDVDVNDPSVRAKVAEAIRTQRAEPELEP